MGVNFGAILGHHLAPEEVPTLPQRLHAAAAPELAQAVAHLARVSNARTARHAPPPLPLPEEGDWTTSDQLWLPLYLDERGRFVFDAPATRIETLPGGRRRAVAIKPVAYHRVGVAELWSRHQWITVEGPADLELDVGPRACLLHPVDRWWSFLNLSDVRVAFRRVCFALARLLDSPPAIYIPTSSYLPSGARERVGEGDSLEEVIAWLREQCGPPAPSIDAISIKNEKAGTWSGDGYYIDTFADLATNRT